MVSGWCEFWEWPEGAEKWYGSGIAGSSNGRTPPFGGGYRGSSP